MHSHGKTRYSNEHVDLESLRPDRPDGARLIVLPNINVQGGTRTERVTSLRDQIHHVSLILSFVKHLVWSVLVAWQL